MAFGPCPSNEAAEVEETGFAAESTGSFAAAVPPVIKLLAIGKPPGRPPARSVPVAEGAGFSVTIGSSPPGTLSLRPPPTRSVPVAVGVLLARSVPVAAECRRGGEHDSPRELKLPRPPATRPVSVVVGSVSVCSTALSSCPTLVDVS